MNEFEKHIAGICQEVLSEKQEGGAKARMKESGTYQAAKCMSAKFVTDPNTFLPWWIRLFMSKPTFFRLTFQYSMAYVHFLNTLDEGFQARLDKNYPCMCDKCRESRGDP